MTKLFSCGLIATTRQTLRGTGYGAIFYEGHVTSLAARDKKEK